MESKVAEAAEQALIAQTQALSPEHRLNAFLVHSRLLMELHKSGLRVPASPLPIPPAES